MSVPEFQEQKEIGQRLFLARQYAEAIPLLKSAAEAFPKDEPLWQELVLAAHHSEQYEQAIDFAKQAIRNHPRSGWLWRQLGCELITADRLDEAEKVLGNAQSLLSQHDEWLWRNLAALHRRRKVFEKEIEALENLHALGKANATDLNQLGLAYHNHKPPNLAKALEFYRLATTTGAHPPYFFNMGLVFNDREVSQDADAADAYRRALALKPDYEPAKERLDATKRKLVPLAERARMAATGLVQSDEMFQFYVSPFEMLQIEAAESVEEPDVKAVQHAKKRLLQEIDLNDGKVSWLDDYPLDKSRAIALADDLYDKAKWRYHWAIFQNKRLLRFLTRGDIGHFLYADDYFPRETLELLDKEAGFRAFLSKPFARQYNLVLTRAIERRLLPVVEVLFDGRRWVDPEDDDTCFEGAFRHVNDCVEQIRVYAEEGKKRKVGIQDIQMFLEQRGAVSLFNLLPMAFRTAQTQLVQTIRELAVAIYNKHDDSELSAQILGLCKNFNFKSVDLNKRLDEDFKIIERIISEQRQTERIVAEGVAEQQRNQELSSKPGFPRLGWLAFVAIIIILGVVLYRDSTKTTPSGGSHTPPSAPSSPAYMSAELARDKQAIDSEKAKAERMASELESLGREIEQKRLRVDGTSQFDVDEFNRKVGTYNGLLEKVRMQDRLVNQLVDSYNEKLRRTRR